MRSALTAAATALLVANAIAPAGLAGVATGKPPARPSGEETIARGRKIAAFGNDRAGTACSSCHAFDGTADPSGAFPRLAGQSAYYMKASLDAFASGARKSAIMRSIAESLTEAQRGEAAAYYASLRSPVPPSPPADPSMVEHGEALATVGSDEQQIPACIACHGPSGRSAMPTIPTLAGQYRNYIVLSLKTFKNGRRGIEHGSMGAISGALSDEQMEAVGTYFQSQDAGGVEGR